MFPSSLLGLVNSLLKNNIEQHLTNSQITTVHPSRDGHSIDISACGVWGAKAETQVSIREFYIHIHLN